MQYFNETNAKISEFGSEILYFNDIYNRCDIYVASLGRKYLTLASFKLTPSTNLLYTSRSENGGSEIDLMLVTTSTVTSTK